MKKLVLFLSVLLFSSKSEAVCPYPYVPECQVASNVTENGQVVFKQSYCKGDFPYCETFGGDCCSDPSYRSEGGWGCCDSSVYVAHLVASISPGGVALDVGAYKCCSIAEYGKNSTFYFDKEEHVHCCGGKVYQAKSGDEKSCCNHKFDSEGNVTQYYTVATVMGAPEGEVNQMCCKTIGDAPGKYRATAYWNGNSARCCEGTVYKTGVDDSDADTYGCCSDTRGPKAERENGVVSVLGAPNGEQACCGYYEEENEEGTTKKFGTAYWDDDSVSCCDGVAYQPKGDSVKEYDCCWDGTVPVDVQGGQEIKKSCCEEGEKAYWNGSWIECCSGGVYKSGTNSSGKAVYSCCSKGTHPVSNQLGKIACCSEGIDQAGGDGTSARCCPAGEFECTVSNVENKIACGEEGCATAHTWIPGGWITGACKPEKICKT